MILGIIYYVNKPELQKREKFSMQMQVQHCCQK